MEGNETSLEACLSHRVLLTASFQWRSIFSLSDCLMHEGVLTKYLIVKRIG